MGVHTRAMQSIMLGVCLTLVICHAGASLPQAETPAGHTAPVPHLSAQNLRALGTSFSQKISKALRQSLEEHKASTTSVDVDDDDAAPFEVHQHDAAPIEVYQHETNKPTLGNWFQDLLKDMEKQFEAENEPYHRDHSKEPSSYEDDDDSPYARHGRDQQYPRHEQHQQDHYKQYPRHEQHQQDHYRQEGPEHDGPWHKQYDMEQYERYYQQYQEQYSGSDSKAEESCLQEVARKNCLAADSNTTTANDDTLRFTSSLGCCFSSDEQDRYYEESSYSGEPDYPAYASLMAQRAHKRARAITAASSSKGSAASVTTASAKVAYYDTPTVFFPRGGNSECVWSLAYHEPVQVDATTTQIGIASATCNFNGSMEHCHGLPLGNGAIFTVQGDIYRTTIAVSKYAPPTLNVSADCAADPTRRANTQRASAKVAQPVQPTPAASAQKASTNPPEAAAQQQLAQPADGKQPAQIPAGQQPSAGSPLPAVQKPAKLERGPARTASANGVKTAAGYGMEGRYKENGMDGPYKEVSYSWEQNRPSGMYGGEAIIITGVITSFSGLSEKFDYQHGMVEYVAAYNGRPLTNAQYEALPYDVPHIKPGGYKLVLVGDADESSY